MRVLKIVSIVVLLVCLPFVVFAGPLVNFEDETTGASVEGLGTIHPMLNIQATPDAVVIGTFTDPKAYGAPSPLNTSNACLEDADGNRVYDNSEKTAKGFGSPQTSSFVDWSYDFSFAEGKSVSAFAIRVFDVGDYNPSLATDHSVILMAYDAMANLVDTDEITFITPKQGNPTSSDPYGNLLYGAGDACDANFGEPGYFELSVGSPTGIAMVELRATGQDPKVGFDSIDFTPCTR
ncbi:MAG: hypothetical protein KAU27_05755, partial [Desulfuromonadales bacterium]|nr:hypothetical protein [Desulfuromonadales bacterium]